MVKNILTRRISGLLVWDFDKTLHSNRIDSQTEQFTKLIAYEKW